NTITLDHSGGNTFVIDRNGSIVGTFADAQITAGIGIASGNGTGGNDVVNIRATVKPVTPDGAGGQDTVTLGKGGNVQGILAPVKIINVGGHTALTIDDSADPVQQTVTMDVQPDTVNGVTGLFATVTNLAPGAISIRGSDVSSLTV